MAPCKCFGACECKCIHHIPLMTIPSCKSILTWIPINMVVMHPKVEMFRCFFCNGSFGWPITKNITKSPPPSSSIWVSFTFKVVQVISPTPPITWNLPQSEVHGDPSIKINSIFLLAIFKGVDYKSKLNFTLFKSWTSSKLLFKN